MTNGNMHYVKNFINTKEKHGLKQKNVSDSRI